MRTHNTTALLKLGAMLYATIEFGGLPHVKYQRI